MWRRLFILLGVTVLGALPPGGVAPLGAASVPELDISAPPELAALATRLRLLDADALRRTAELVGLADAGPPIPVLLALEGSVAARRAPSWGVAYATSSGHVVLVPSRVPSYPHRRLEGVLLHEVAHVLIDRAARGRPVPRWFHEGLALHAARDQTLEDRSRVLWGTWRGHGSALAAMERRFQGGAASAARAYAFSGAFMRWVIDRHGDGAPARILAGVASGAAFDEAFRAAAGVTLADEEELFFRHLDLWNKWVPLATSSATLWTAITVLALVAFQRRRRRDEEIRSRWDGEEEVAELERLPTDEWVN